MLLSHCFRIRWQAVTRTGCLAFGLLALAAWTWPVPATSEALAQGAPAGSPADAGRGSVPAELDRASRLLLRGDADGAIREYEALVARAPSDPMAPVACLAVSNLLLEAKRDTTAALSWCERVVRDYPTSSSAPAAAEFQAKQLTARRDWAAAGDAWIGVLRLLGKGAATRTRRAEIAGTAADCFEKAGDESRLMAACRGMLAGAPPPELAALALWRLGQVLEGFGLSDSAAVYYARVIRSYPSAAEFTKAMEKRQMVEKRVPIDWRPYEIYLRGSAAIGRADYAAGLANTDSLLASTTDPALLECGEYRKLTCETWVGGDLVRGVRELRAYLAKYPDGLRAATARQTLDERWQPLADLQQGALDAPDDVQSQLTMGDTFVRYRLYKSGMEALEKAATLSPDDPDVLFALGHGYAVSGRLQDAQVSFDKCVQKRPDDPQTLNLIGYALLGVGQAALALPYFDRYAALSPDDPNAHDSYGEGLLAAGRAADSVREYERALALRPEFDNAAFMLGRAYRELGNVGKARAAFEKFLELQPAGDRAAEARQAIAEMEKGKKP
jgi:tetratricopeptide (TPR) repeat protein